MREKMPVDSDASRPTIIFQHPERHFARTCKVSIEELFEDFDGEEVPLTDLPTNGNEVDWGEPVGGEAW